MPSLCLPVPQPCGDEGQPCCPPPSDLGASFTCRGAGLACRGAGVDRSYQALLDLQLPNGTVPAQAFGTCVRA